MYIYTQISFGASNLGIGFTLQYYVSILMTQIYNLFFDSTNKKQYQYPKITSNFIHQYSGYNLKQTDRTSHQFLASCPIDIFNENREYLFVGGGENQDDALFHYQNNKLINIMNSSFNISDKSSATYSAFALDMNNNGMIDLVVARQNGIFIYENNSVIDNNNNKIIKFRKISVLNNKSFIDSSPISICACDIENNSKPSIYISQFTYPSKLKPFQFNNIEHWKKNILMENLGDYNFIDSTRKYNLEGNQNTFTSSFIKLKNKILLISANDTGKIEFFIKNDNQTQFEQVKTNLPNGFWMGLAIGDINNNGKLDLFATNLGQDIPLPVHGSNKGTRGNEKTGLKDDQILTHDHLLLTDIEYFSKLKNMADKYNIGKGGIGWGCVFEDFSLNGYLDLFYAQNYVDMQSLKKYEGGVYFNDNNINNFDGINYVKIGGLENNEFGHTPIFCNFNGLLKDLIWINVHSKIHGYQNSNVLNNNFISINIPRITKYMNCEIKFENNGVKMIRHNIIGGIGLSGDQSGLFTFGIGKSKLVNQKMVITLKNNQTIDVTNKIKINDTIYL
jgi:hypothetical protein